MTRNMKLIGISGSPRDKNTNYMLRTVLESSGLPYELILLKDRDIHHCRACGGCYKDPHRCEQNDEMQEIYAKILAADVVVLGTPTHFDNVSDIMKSFMDRCLPFYFSHELKGKKAILLTVGNYHQEEEYTKDGKCIWQDAEIKSVTNCLSSLESFCSHVDLEIIRSHYAIHGKPQDLKEELIGIGDEIRKLLT